MDRRDGPRESGGLHPGQTSVAVVLRQSGSTHGKTRAVRETAGI